MHAVRAPHAFDGARFLPGGATVLVEDDQIKGVEPFGYDVPHDCSVASYDGTLLPGLIDAHVHLVAGGTRAGERGSLEAAGGADVEELDRVIGESLRAQAAAGVTTVRDLGDVGYRALHHRDLEAPGLPRIRAAGPPLTVDAGHCHYLGGVVDPTPAGIRDAVAERVARGVDVIKVMASGGMLTPGSDQLGAQFEVETLRELVGTAHAAGLRVLAHSHSRLGIERAVAAGVDGLEHFTSLTADGMDTPDALLADIAAAGITIDPTVGFDAGTIAPIGAMPPRLRELVERLGLTPELMRAQRSEQLARVRSHGIRLVSGLDAGVSPPKRHGLLWLAVEHLVDAGYPVEEAVATATSGAADDLEVPAGRLTPGLSADLLAVEGDLSRDVTALGRPTAVVVRGVPLSP